MALLTRILDSQLRYAVWDEERMQSWAWDPQVYGQAAGNALSNLMAREFAPLPERLGNAITRNCTGNKTAKELAAVLGVTPAAAQEQPAPVAGKGRIPGAVLGPA